MHYRNLDSISNYYLVSSRNTKTRPLYRAYMCSFSCFTHWSNTHVLHRICYEDMNGTFTINVATSTYTVTSKSIVAKQLETRNGISILFDWTNSANKNSALFLNIAYVIGLPRNQYFPPQCRPYSYLRDVDGWSVVSKPPSLVKPSSLVMPPSLVTLLKSATVSENKTHGNRS